jgi:hypothetical protein
LPAKLGRYKNYDSKWLILSVSLDGNLDVGHTALVYQSEVDLEADTCGFTLQWVSDITVSLFTNNKRQLKLLTATLTPSNLREWGEYLAARRNPSAVRLGNNILQLWVAL